MATGGGYSETMATLGVPCMSQKSQITNFPSSYGYAADYSGSQHRCWHATSVQLVAFCPRCAKI